MSKFESLTELVRRKGGVKDFGGELADMLGGRTVRKVRKKSGRVHYARSGRGIIRRKGMDLDDMRHVAIEEGFLPEDASINTLLDALADESRGRVRRSIHDDIEMPERVYVEPRKRKPERPTIPAHPGNKKCSKCGVLHGKNAHRFHGPGSYVRTHKFLKYFESNPGVPMTISDAKKYVVYYTGLIRHGMQLVREERDLLIRARQLMRKARHPVANPKRKGKTGLTKKEYQRLKYFERQARDLLLKRGLKYRATKDGLVKENPRKRIARKNCNPPGGVKVYGRLLRIEAQKIGKHRCDAGCAKANHSYFHDFGPGAVVYGMADGSLRVTSSNGKKLWNWF